MVHCKLRSLKTYFAPHNQIHFLILERQREISAKKRDREK